MGFVKMMVKTVFPQVEILDAVRAAAQERLVKCALLVEREAKLSMKSGRAGKGVYIPSPVGTPPHVRSGNLRGSIQTAQAGEADWGLAPVDVGPTAQAPYGAVHEFSTSRPRKFMLPALLRVMKQFASLFIGLSVKMNVPPPS